MGFIPGKVCLVQRSWLAEEGEGNGRARSLRGLGGFRSHRHSGLRQQLQRAGHADVRGHGQQPARIVPVMSPLQEQRRFFISPSSRHLPCGQLLGPAALQRKFSRAASAQAQSGESAERTWRSSESPAPRRCNPHCGLCATKPKRTVRRPRQECVLKRL